MTNIDIFTPLTCSASCSHNKKRLYPGRIQWCRVFDSDTSSTYHFARTSFGQDHTRIPCLYFARLPIYHFSHHPPPDVCVCSAMQLLQRPCHSCGRRFSTLPTLDQNLWWFVLMKAIPFLIPSCAWLHSRFLWGGITMSIFFFLFIYFALKKIESWRNETKGV